MSKPPDNPYFSEAGVDVFSAGYASHFSTRLQPSIPIVDSNSINRAAVNALLGVPSRLCIYNAEQHSLEPKHKIRLAASSSTSLESAMNEFCHSGTLILKLESLVRLFGTHASTGGVMRMAFVRGLEAFLQEYRSSILLNVNDESSLLDILVKTASDRDKLEYVARICRHDELPGGASLLSYLYLCALECRPKYLPLTLALLRTASEPYLNMCRQWLFWGRFQDHFSEFGITLRKPDSESEDWWDSIGEDRGPGFWPVFLLPVRQKIFSSGKVVKLLLDHDRTHPLADAKHTPELSLCFNRAGLDRIHQDSAVHRYQCSVELSGRSFDLSMKRMKEKDAENDAFRQRISAARARWAEIHRAVAAARAAKAQKQRVLREDLLSQIAAREEKRTVKMEEEIIALTSLPGSLPLNDEHLHIISEIAAEMEAEYASLKGLPSPNKEKIRWRMDRRRLTPKRNEVLRIEREHVEGKGEESNDMGSELNERHEEQSQSPVEKEELQEEEEEDLIDPLWNDSEVSTESGQDEEIDLDAIEISETGRLIVPLSVVVEQSLLQTIDAQSHLVNVAALQLFFQELNLSDCFSELREYALLRAGEFAEVFSERLKDRLDQGQLWTCVQDLNAILDNCLKAVGSDTDKLSFKLLPIPSSCNADSSDALDSLVIHYRVDWPLSVAFSGGIMDAYANICRFMLTVRRASLTLRECWVLLRQRQASTATYLLLHKMYYFINELQGYFSTQLLEVCWTNFQSDLGNVRDVSSLRQAHHDYVLACAKVCLLNEQAAPVMKIVREIINLIFRFRLEVLSDSDLNDTNDTFSKYVSFFLKVLVGLVQKGYQPHLSSLVLRYESMK